ncbi:MAG: hypothetical protein ACRETB_02025 [Steroidobacteraceae bacterium]
MRTPMMRRSLLAEAVRLALWAAALCAAAILVASLSTETSFGAGAEYHTEASQSAGASQSTSTSEPAGTWSTGPAAAQPAGTLTVPAQGDLETRLQDARKRLERDAREVAVLSAQLGTRALSEGQGAQDEAFAARVEAAWARNGAFALMRNRRGVVGLRLDPASGRTGARVQEVSPGGPGPAGAGAFPPMPPAPPAPPGVPGQVGGPVVAPPLPGLPYFEALSAETAGLELVALTPALGSYFGTDKGVLVVRAPADDAFRLADGDVIVSIGGREPRNGAHATRILSSYGPGEQLVLKIVRHRKPVSLTIALPGHAPR